ncbi:hypothetical protein [Aureimonas sp. ME7]|uniref:hypothetical protein n=1 Tax=Aureimonas sp. ME7 TaxID=2744252 RepID=UPI0015FACB44|nr:hypothetical protein [Aureimonas sp. ME7]
MRTRDLILIIGAMACFTMAIATLILINGQTTHRSERNIQIICDELQKLNGKPCQLLQPSDTETKLFAFIRRR